MPIGLVPGQESDSCHWVIPHEKIAFRKPLNGYTLECNLTVFRLLREGDGFKSKNSAFPAYCRAFPKLGDRRHYERIPPLPTF
jgi:hypothetical protein